MLLIVWDVSHREASFPEQHQSTCSTPKRYFVIMSRLRDIRGFDFRTYHWILRIQIDFVARPGTRVAWLARRKASARSRRRGQAEKRGQALYRGKGDFGFVGPCPPVASFTSDTDKRENERTKEGDGQRLARGLAAKGDGKQGNDKGGGMPGGERAEDRKKLRNGNSDRDFNVEHTRFELIGPLRLAWEAVDMVQQLPLPPQIPPPSSLVCLRPRHHIRIRKQGGRDASVHRRCSRG